MPERESGPEAPPSQPASEEPSPAPETEEAQVVEEPLPAPEEEPSTEEEYEELITPEKPVKPRIRKKRKHLGAIITTIVIILVLVVWTLASPKILAVEGRTYVDSHDYYANLGSFVGYSQNWAANTTWGISVHGPRNVTVNETFTISILITKVAERPSNFWFRGTAITITNMSVIDESEHTIALLSNKSDPGFGKEGSIHVLLNATGNHTLSVKAQFLVYVDMRIGFLPVEKINLLALQLNPINVNEPSP